jgi:GTP-binding protein HflX
LSQLGIDPQRKSTDKPSLIEVWNKIDRLDPDARAQLENLAGRRAAEERPVLVSAISGEGIGALGEAIETRLAAGRVVIELTLEAADGAGVSWLHRHTEVIRKAVNQESGQVAMTVRTAADRANAVRERFSSSVRPFSN